MLTNRERGDRFDLWVLTQVEPFVTNLRLTIGSGSVFGDQDQVCEEFRISCKLRQDRGLTRAELTEPYGREAIGSFRCPLTVLRTGWQTEDGIEWLDFAAADAPALLTIYGRDLLALAIRSHLEDLEILDDWPAGLSRGLLDMTSAGKVSDCLRAAQGQLHNHLYPA